jgi:hypothetical protein
MPELSRRSSELARRQPLEGRCQPKNKQIIIAMTMIRLKALRSLRSLAGGTSLVVDSRVIGSRLIEC